MIMSLILFLFLKLLFRSYPNYIDIKDLWQEIIVSNYQAAAIMVWFDPEQLIVLLPEIGYTFLAKGK